MTATPPAMSIQQLTAMAAIRMSLLQERMEYQIAYGSDFFDKSEQEQRVIVLTRRLDLHLKGISTCP